MLGALAVVIAAVAAALVVGRRPSLLGRRLTSGIPGPESPPNTRVSIRSDRNRGLSRLSVRRWLAGRSLAVRREDDIVDACLALGAELHAGTPVPRALAAAAEDWPELFGPAAAAAAVGGDVAAAFHETAKAPGAGSLRAVAAAWRVTDSTGAALSAIMTAVADTLRIEAAIRREAHSQLAAVRATARLLAVLPFGTLLLLSGGDGAAVSFLVRTPVGLGCLAMAVAFVAGGLWWIDRLARSATRSMWEA